MSQRGKIITEFLKIAICQSIHKCVPFFHVFPNLRKNEDSFFLSQTYFLTRKKLPDFSCFVSYSVFGIVTLGYIGYFLQD